MSSVEATLKQQLHERTVASEAEKRHKMAGVLALDDGSLFANMFDGDREAEVLLKLPGAEKLLTRCARIGYFESVFHLIHGWH